MNTPICDFAERYRNRRPIRLHMPGHKGTGTLGVESLDITEIEGADILYHASGIIRESEENASSLFGTAQTVYSTEGSSLCIRAMLYLAMLHSRANGEPKVLIAAARNAHQVFMTAAALLDVEIVWLRSGRYDSILSCQIDPEQLDAELAAMPRKPAAVYITSPDYPGYIADIAAIAKVCHRNGVLLLVDNAHGAYLRFLSPSLHPIDAGADLCCDSAHKTLPVLTGGAYLHISRTAPESLRSAAERSMALFASTSPSYLILQSLDAANRYLSEGYSEQLQVFTGQLNQLKNRLRQNGYRLIGNEPLKLTIDAKSYGYTGTGLAQALEQYNIICEFADTDLLVTMFTPAMRDLLKDVETALLQIQRLPAIETAPPLPDVPERVLSPREALFSPHCRVPVCEAVGKILASPSVSCPPAVPILVCGERIDENAVRTFLYYGMTECDVVKSKE